MVIQHTNLVNCKAFRYKLITEIQTFIFWESVAGFIEYRIMTTGMKKVSIRLQTQMIHHNPNAAYDKTGFSLNTHYGDESFPDIVVDSL